MDFKIFIARQIHKFLQHTKWMTENMRSPKTIGLSWVARTLMNYSNAQVSIDIVNRMKLKKTDHVLELGVGNGLAIKEIAKMSGNKIIGVTCHNSIKFAKFAIKAKASYLAFGAFFPSKTKRTKYQASLKNLKEASKLTKIPLVAIGGINPQNYKKLLLNKANFLAISSYIWKNKKYKPLKAIERFK